MNTCCDSEIVHIVLYCMFQQVHVNLTNIVTVLLLRLQPLKMVQIAPKYVVVMTLQIYMLNSGAWTGPWGSRRLRLQNFQTIGTHEGGKVVSLTHRPFLPPGRIPGNHFCQRLSPPQGHNATKRIKSLKNSSDYTRCVD